MLSPVERERAVAFHVEVAGVAGWDGTALVVENFQLVARDGLPARTGPHLVEPVRAVDVKHLRGADAVEDGEAERILPAPPDLSREGFRGRDAVSYGGEVAGLGA